MVILSQICDFHSTAVGSNLRMEPINRVSRTRRTLTTYGVVALVALVRPIFGWDLYPQPPRILHPRTYFSPSGRYTLLVDPSDMCGRFGASYRLTRQGREIWSGQQPFTLWEAAVSDDGVVAGYAYSLGWSGYNQARDDAGHGDFHVILIDRKGSLRSTRSPSASTADTQTRRPSRLPRDCSWMRRMIAWSSVLPTSTAATKRGGSLKSRRENRSASWSPKR